MGVWLLAKGTLQVEPPLDEDTVWEYIEFSRNTWPNEYMRMDEVFANPWFFNDENELISIPCKFAECSVWLPYIARFFNDRGYVLTGDPDIVGEGESGFHWKANAKAYDSWRQRVELLIRMNVKHHLYGHCIISM